MTQSHQDKITEKEISQDPKDYISIYRLLMYAKATSYNEWKEYFDIKELLSERTPINEDDEICYNYIMKNQINRPLSEEFLTLNLTIFKEMVDIIKKHSPISIYEQTTGLRREIKKIKAIKIDGYAPIEPSLASQLDLLKAIYDDYDEMVKEMGKEDAFSFLYEDYIGLLTDFEFTYITREIAETVFNYPKEYRPDGYNEQKELEAKNQKLKADLEAKERELNALKNNFDEMVAKIKRLEDDAIKNPRERETLYKIVRGLYTLIENQKSLTGTKYLEIKQGSKAQNKINPTSVGNELSAMVGISSNTFRTRLAEIYKETD